MEKYDDEKGVWRTIRGRRVFIRDGESLGSAMARSGKFKNLTRTKISEAKDELHEKDFDNKAHKYNNRYGETKKNYQRKMQKLNNKYKAKDKYYIENRGTEQAEKNRINENASTFGSKSRVWNNQMRYSEEDRRELRHEKLQKKLAEYKVIEKKLADYKAKKQSNYKMDGKNITENDLKKEYEKERLRGNIDEDYNTWKKNIVDDRNSNVKSNNKVETWEEKVKRLEKENAKNKNYEIPKQSNNKSDLVGLKKEGNTYIPIRKDDEANKELKTSDLKTKTTKEIMDMKVPQTKEGKKAFNKFIAENRSEIAKELKNGDYNGNSIGNYMKTLSREPKENDLILGGGENGEDVRVGKNGKLEALTDDDFDSNNVYVGKKQKIEAYKKRKGK